jgi:hypothetical protein
LVAQCEDRVVSVIYRLAPPESKDFTRGSFGTMHPEAAKFVAEVEAGSDELPPDRRLYQVTVTMGDRALSERLIEDFLPFVERKPKDEALPRLRDFLLNEATRGGSPWMQIAATRHARLHAAMIYVGEKPVRTQLAPAELER